MKSLLLVLMDQSGSMNGKQDDVIGGVNRFIEDQRGLGSDAWLTLIKFDTEYESIYSSVHIEGARLLKPADYVPRGGTALLDSLGRAISELDTQCALKMPNKVIVVVVTDGQENSSKEFKLEKIKALISEREKSGNWTFVYLGASPTAFNDATAMGFQFANSAQYTNSKKGTETVYGVMSESVKNLRNGAVGASLGKEIGEDLSKEIGKIDGLPAWTPVQKP